MEKGDLFSNLLFVYWIAILNFHSCKTSLFYECFVLFLPLHKPSITYAKLLSMYISKALVLMQVIIPGKKIAKRVNPHK